jgi:hypothetical protein
MHSDYPPRETVRERFLPGAPGIASLLADPQYGGQVLARLPNGEYAWLRLQHHSVRIVETVTFPRHEDDALTELARRGIAHDCLSGPWPTVAEAEASAA